MEVAYMLCSVAEKKAILNLRLSPSVRDDFALAAKLRGASMSGLIHQFIVRTIKEERAESPQSFRQTAVRATDKLGKLPKRLQNVDEKILNGATLAPNSTHKMRMQRTKSSTGTEGKKRKTG